MFRAALIVLLLPASGLAAPVPKETEADKLKRLFSTPVDPEKNSKFSLNGDKLVLRVSDSRRHFQLGDRSAPRVTRPVEGDFTATVQIRLPLPRWDEPLPLRGNLILAGMFLSDEGSLLAVHSRVLNLTPGQKDPFQRQGRFQIWYPNGGSSSVSGGAAFTPETVHFRFRRDKGELFTASSADGKTWHEFGRNQTQFPDKSTLGLYLANPSGIAYGVEFEGFTVISKAKK